MTNILTDEYKRFFEKWGPISDAGGNNPFELYKTHLAQVLHHDVPKYYHNCIPGNNTCNLCRCPCCGKPEKYNTKGLWYSFAPVAKQNQRFYNKIYRKHFCQTSKLHELYYNACLMILDLPVALDENPELFYDFHPFVRDILLKDEYVPLFHDVDVHKELRDTKAELASMKEKLAVAEAKKESQLVQDLESVLIPTSFNPFD